MCGGPPCIKSCCGLSLQKTVFYIGVVELVITGIITIANVWKYVQTIDVESEDCKGKDICIGPIIKYCVFDAFFGVLCALILMVGAKRRNSCLLITWIIITIICSIKYIVTICLNDWTSLEDWIAITYLVFYTSICFIIISFLKEARGGSDGYVHSYEASAPPPYSP